VTRGRSRRNPKSGLRRRGRRLQSGGVPPQAKVWTAPTGRRLQSGGVPPQAKVWTAPTKSALSKRRRAAASQSLDCATSRREAAACRRAGLRRFQSGGVPPQSKVWTAPTKSALAKRRRAAAIQSLDCADEVGAFKAAACRRNPKFGLRRRSRRLQSGDSVAAIQSVDCADLSALSKRRRGRRKPKCGLRRRVGACKAAAWPPQAKVWTAPTKSALAKRRRAAAIQSLGCADRSALSKRRRAAAIQSLGCADRSALSKRRRGRRNPKFGLRRRSRRLQSGDKSPQSKVWSGRRSRRLQSGDVPPQSTVWTAPTGRRLQSGGVAARKPKSGLRRRGRRLQSGDSVAAIQSVDCADLSALSKRRRAAAIQSVDCADGVGTFKAAAWPPQSTVWTAPTGSALSERRRGRRNPKFGLRRRSRRFQSGGVAAAIQSLDCADEVGAFKAAASAAAIQSLDCADEVGACKAAASAAASHSLDCADGVGACKAAACRRNPQFGLRRRSRRLQSGDVPPQSTVWTAPTGSALSERRLRRRKPKSGLRRRSRRFRSGGVPPQSKVWTAPTKSALAKRRRAAAIQSVDCADGVGACKAATCRRNPQFGLRRRGRRLQSGDKSPQSKVWSGRRSRRLQSGDVPPQSKVWSGRRSRRLQSGDVPPQSTVWTAPTGSALAKRRRAAAIQSVDCADGVGAFKAAACRRNPKCGLRRRSRRLQSGDSVAAIQNQRRISSSAAIRRAFCSALPTVTRRNSSRS
jgi:hypothetical protein